MLVTLIVALAVGWGVDHRWQTLELARIQASQRQAEGSVEILTKMIEELGYTVSLPNSQLPVPNLPKP
jgi:hypothetical protein